MLSAAEMTIDDQKRAAAQAALDELPAAGVIGLGTGSTTRFFVHAVAGAIAAGRRLVAVATSEDTRAEATALGIRLLDDDGPWSIEVAFDGADEVTPALDLIKGNGGAHTREKIVSYAAAKTVIMVDSTKLSPRLGEHRPLPIEILTFGHKTTAEALARFGRPVLRTVGELPVRTPAGGVIYDLHLAPIDDPRQLDTALRAIPGVVETGLFIDRADVVLIGSERGVERRVRDVHYGSKRLPII
jgi:ribose 5-phosphate isomerase A